MPPRGRTRKVGLKRIDAAIDALLPLGFSKEVVRKTINNLLKVYDGDAGWVFIEEASYKLVIETILEEQEKDKIKEQGEAIDELRALEISGKVVEACETSSHLEAITGRLHSDQWLNHIQQGPSERALTLGEVERHSIRSSDAGTSILQHSNDPPRQRRPPCNGWISESEDDEDPQDNPLVNQNQDAVEDARGTRRERKRPSGWDVKPNL